MIIKDKKIGENPEPIILKPDKNCRICLGRGWVRYIVPENNSKQVRPCGCVKAVVKEFPNYDADVTQVVR